MIYPTFTEIQALLVGRGGKLRSAKPKNGFAAYVWRMTRFHGGIDTTMPVMCEFDMWNWIEQQEGTKIKADNPLRKQAMQYADSMVDDMCTVFKLDKNAAAKRWGRALGYL